jgi:hypothetical protein
MINEEMRPQVERLAAQSTQSDTGKRLEALQYARAQVQANVSPQLVLDAVMVKLKDPWIG